MIAKVETVDCLETKSEIDAILQEARLIKDIRPVYNTDLVDSKTFPYLEITTREQFPGVYITRNPKDPRSRLFGPFTAVNDLRAALVVLQKIYRFRTCNLDIREEDDKRRFFRPCILHNIHQCTAPCGDRIEKPEYRKIINDLIQFLQSKRSTVLRQLRQQMEEAAAAGLRNGRNLPRPDTLDRVDSIGGAPSRATSSRRSSPATRPRPCRNSSGC